MSAAFEQLAEEQRRVVPGALGLTYDTVLAGEGVSGIALVGLCTILVAAWGGIAPFVGPLFGYDPTGTGPWYWDLSHGVLAAAPGGAGVVAGVSMLVSASLVAVGVHRAGLTGAGLLAMLVGGWFAIGPNAWPLLVPAGPYFAAASPFHQLTGLLGTSLGPGLLLTACGASTVGWALRRRPLSRERQALTTLPASRLTTDDANEPASRRTRRLREAGPEG